MVSSVCAWIVSVGKDPIVCDKWVKQREAASSEMEQPTGDCGAPDTVIRRMKKRKKLEDG